MVKILRESETTLVSPASIYAWRKRFYGVDVKDAKRIRELERENARLKKFLAEKELGIEIMREIKERRSGERVRSQTLTRGFKNL